MGKSLIERMGGTRMIEIRSGTERIEESQLGPLQAIARYLGLRAYTPKGQRIKKVKKKYHGQMKLITFVEQTGETVYERVYWEKTGDSVKPPRKHYNFKAYQDFNPYYDLTN
jgi:hypothetical protein